MVALYVQEPEMSERNACRASGDVKGDLFARLESGAVGVGFQFFGVPVLGELADGIHELRFSEIEELFESI